MTPPRLLRLAPVLVLVAACAPSREDPPAPVVYQGTQPADAPAAEAPQPAPVAVAAEPSGPDARGVRFYDGYETIVADEGDTVASMAARVGLSGAELAAYNGLSTSFQPRTGDELVLPAQAGGYRSAAAAPAPAPVLEPAPVQSAALDDEVAPAEEESGSGWSAARVLSAIQNSDAEESPPAAEAPVAAETAPAPQPVAAAPVAEPAPEPTQPALQAEAPAPQPQPEPVAAAPAPQAVAAEPLNAAPASGRFARPVDAPITRPFSKTPGPNRNDGVDFAAAPGAPVRAAEDGTVVLVSQSLGGLGTIVLIRHQGRYLTVYGRVDEVNVAKGDSVRRGQVFAQVAALAPPRTPALHFEVRDGAESVDPEAFL